MTRRSNVLLFWIANFRITSAIELHYTHFNVVYFAVTGIQLDEE